MVTIFTSRLTFNLTTTCPQCCIYVFWVDVRTYCDCFFIQLYLTGFCNTLLTLYSPMVTIFTTRLRFHESTICPHSCIYVFCADLRKPCVCFFIQHYLTGFCNTLLTLYCPVVTIFTTRLTFNKSTICPHGCMYVFCVGLKINCDCFYIQHYLTGFSNTLLTLYSPVVAIFTTRLTFN